MFSYVVYMKTKWFETAIKSQICVFWIKQLIYDFIIAQSFYKPLLCFWVGINKSCYWNCFPGPSNRPRQQRELHLSRCQYPLINCLENSKFIYLMWPILRNFWLEKKSWKSKKLGLTHILHPKWKKSKSGQMIRTVLLFNPKLPTHTWMTSSLTSIKTMMK